MRRYVVLAAACVISSFALTASAQAANTSIGTQAPRAKAAPAAKTPKPKVEQFCNEQVLGPYNLYIYPKTKAFTIEGFADEGFLEKKPKGVQVLNETAAFGFYYEGKKVKGTKRYVGFAYISGEPEVPVTGAEWGIGILGC